ncbi:acyltransferase [Methanogenium organophilum]|uniref:Acyltransferase n=1 Tax=Methanogenium organophilum TaxID=2199 RepID=A0A9X9S6A5_METOG|nr:acyltransferase [Methanogenium organophilum]WAI02523.1 acyltransferase [Methanogenium organophilum]
MVEIDGSGAGGPFKDVPENPDGQGDKTQGRKTLLLVERGAGIQVYVFGIFTAITGSIITEPTIHTRMYPHENAVTGLLNDIRDLLSRGPDEEATDEILRLIGVPMPGNNLLYDARIYSDYLPKSEELIITPEKRHLHLLWDAFDRSPLSLAVNFAFPFRRMIARQLFSACGKNFCAECEMRFNFGHTLTVGDDVFINRGLFIDTKGGVTIGNAVGIGEFVRIFTHSHGEANHAERTYAPVTIEPYAKIYTNAMILPGVTIGEGAIVGGGAVVTKDVPPWTLVAGVPAKAIRERMTEGKRGPALNHIWLAHGAFQDE